MTLVLIQMRGMIWLGSVRTLSKNSISGFLHTRLFNFGVCFPLRDRKIGMSFGTSRDFLLLPHQSIGCNSHTDATRYAFMGMTFFEKETLRRYSAETNCQAASKRSLWARARKVRMA